MVSVIRGVYFRNQSRVSSLDSYGARDDPANTESRYRAHFIEAETLNKIGICKLVVERALLIHLWELLTSEQIKRSLCLRNNWSCLRWKRVK